MSISPKLPDVQMSIFFSDDISKFQIGHFLNLLTGKLVSGVINQLSTVKITDWSLRSSILINLEKQSSISVLTVFPGI